MPYTERNYLRQRFGIFIWRSKNHRVVDKSILSQYYLEHHFLYNFSIPGCFGQSGLQRQKKSRNAVSMLLLMRAVFFMFSWAKKIFFIYRSVCTKKLNSFRMRFFLIGNYFILGQNRLLNYLWNLKFHSNSIVSFYVP